MPTTMGLVGDSHHHAMKLRAIFSKFFQTENLIQATPLICKIWQTKLDELLAKFESLPEEYPKGYASQGKDLDINFITP